MKQGKDYRGTIPSVREESHPMKVRDLFLEDHSLVDILLDQDTTSIDPENEEILHNMINHELL